MRSHAIITRRLIRVIESGDEQLPLFPCHRLRYIALYAIEADLADVQCKSIVLFARHTYERSVTSRHGDHYCRYRHSVITKMIPPSKRKAERERERERGGKREREREKERF